MSRQLLLNEIERVRLENNEKKEDMADEVYVFSKYPFLYSLFEQYRIGSEKWHQLAREVLFYTKDDLRYMYDRIMRLIRRFQRNSSEFFTIKTEIGTFTLPDRLSDLNRLFELYIEFFTIIYPNISRKLRFEVHYGDISSTTLSGSINWSKTIRTCTAQGNQTCPLTFALRSQKREFETPENILTVFSVLKLKYDAKLMTEHQFKEPLSYEEHMTLKKIQNGCDNILKTTPLMDLIPNATKYVLMDFNDSRIRDLEAMVNSRLRKEQNWTNPYLQLLQWVQKYRELNLRSVSIQKTNFPIDRSKNLDVMFEIWVMLEFLDYLKIYQSAVITVEEFPKKYSVSLKGLSFNFFYEKIYVGWAANARPDFSIEVNGNLKVIMDAKNWQMEKPDAIYKMLGYLNNLDGTSGVLFFPNYYSLGQQRILKGQTLAHHQNQVLYNCVMVPSASEAAVLQKINALKQTAEIVFRALEQ